MTITILLSILIVLVMALLCAVAFMLFRKPETALARADISTPLQHLSLSIQQGNSHAAVLTEKMVQFEAVVPVINNIQVELKGLSERTSHVEGTQEQVTAALAKVGQGLAQTGTMAQSLIESTNIMRSELSRSRTELTSLAERVSKVDGNQNQFQHGMVALGNQLTQTDTITKGLVQAAAAIRNEIAHTKTDLTHLHAQAKARHEIEHRTAESIRRLETVIAGTNSKGAAGENILEVVFS